MKKSISMIFLIIILIYGCGPLTPYPTSEAAPVPSGTDAPSMLPDNLVAHPELEVITPENITQLKEVDQWGIGEVNDVALSPDGTMVAIATASGVHLFDRKTLKELSLSFVDAFLINYPIGISPPVAISAVDFSSRNDILAVSTQNSVYFWNIKAGLIESRLGSALGAGSIGKILYSPDDMTILVESSGYSSYCDGNAGFFSLYSVNNRSLIYNQIYCSDSALYHSFGFLSNGFLFVLFDEYDYEIKEWRQKIIKVDPLTDSLEEISLAKNDSFVLSLSLDGNLISREYEGKTLVSRFLDFHSQKPIDFIEGVVKYQGDSGRRFLVFDQGWKWQDESGAVLCNFDGNYFDSQYFSDDESVMISWSDREQTLTVRDMKDCTTENNLFLGSGSWNPTFSPDNKLLAIEGWSYTHLLDIQNGEYVYSVPTESRNGFAFVPYQDKFLYGTNGAPYFVRLTTYTGNIVKELDGKDGFLQNISVSADGKKVAILDRGGFGLWGIELNEEPYYKDQNLRSFSSSSSVQFSPDSAEVALVLDTQNSGDRILFLNSDTGEIQREFVGLDYWQVDFSPDWKSFAIADSAGYIIIHDLVEDKELVKLTGFNKINQQNSLVNTLEYNSAGNIIASSKNGLFRFWALPSGQFLGELETGMNNISGLAFSYDDRLMIITGTDGIVCVWGVPKEE